MKYKCSFRPFIHKKIKFVHSSAIDKNELRFQDLVLKMFSEKKSSPHFCTKNFNYEKNAFFTSFIVSFV